MDNTPQLVARLLRTHLSPGLHSYTFIDFCAGGGGPTPSIERHLNGPLAFGRGRGGRGGGQEQRDGEKKPPLQFVLTDLHPHVDLWAQAAARSPNLSYVADPGTNKVFRLFNLAFHHFDDALARKILRDTVDGGGDGFGIFELQDRGMAGFASCCLFGIGTLIMAPYYALLWGAPLALLFTYALPVLPAVLVFDGWMSCLRTRTSDEVEALLRTCGADGGEAEIAKWEVRSGSEMFMWPVGRVNWIIGVKR
ncbi:hypothetical protein VTH06DRAFT_7165 [Thermothelomyces fergusii]